MLVEIYALSQLGVVLAGDFTTASIICVSHSASFETYAPSELGVMLAGGFTLASAAALHAMRQ